MTPTRTVPAYVPFDVEVSHVRRLSPSFLRISFTGPALTGFHPGGPLGPRDTRVKLVVPDVPGRPPGADLDVSDAGWYRSWLALDPAVRGHLRTYTVRRLLDDRTAPSLQIDFVLHLDADGRGGPATVWAASAQPGDRLTLLGPNRHHPDPGGFEWRPPAAAGTSPQQVLLVGDETSLPAIAGILETLPREYAGEAIVEVPCLEDAQQLLAPPGIHVTYLPRNGGLRGAATLRALHTRRPGDRKDQVPPDALDVSADVLWETPGTDLAGPPGLYAWVAGEASVVRDVRRALVGPHGVARDRVAFMGYWRQGRSEG